MQEFNDDIKVFGNTYINTKDNSDEQAYIIGGIVDNDNVKKLVSNPHISFKKDTIYGKTNDYRYVLTGMWNTLGGEIANNIYSKDLFISHTGKIVVWNKNTNKYEYKKDENGNEIETTIDNSYDVEEIITPENTNVNKLYFDKTTSGYGVLRLGRLVTGATNSDFPTGAYSISFILHVHSQRISSGIMSSNCFTCLITKSINTNNVIVVPLALNNDDDDAKIAFISIITIPTSSIFSNTEDKDGYNGVDILVKFKFYEGNIAICASAFMLSDIADLHLEEDYKPTFQFTYNIRKKEEYITKHPNFKGSSTDDKGAYPDNKSSLYIGISTDKSLGSSYDATYDYTTRTGAVEHSLEPINDTLNTLQENSSTNKWLNSDSYAALTSVETDTVYYITEL